ncbi:MAG: transcriptional regulator, partial [Novosphingobium sp.]|nr:transcriptional regulator [Novosphingobium sp.]
MNKKILAELVSDIVCAYVAHNHVAASDVPAMIISVYFALANTGAPTAVAEVARPEPSVSIRSSVKSDALVCLECG